ncbi:hypothetical protein EDC01DRAFT_632931 [Geopyxis carbonaria]|nr:hypothetical protein EDC01DRAFT_632931 [Geopyxis carbonaria]
MTVLTDLPLDILKMILDCIPSQRDLARVSLACSTLRILAQPWLYNRFKITFECGVPSHIPFKCLFNAQNTGAQYIRHLEVEEIGGMREKLNGWDTDFIRIEEMTPDHLIKLETARSFVHLVLQRIPEGRLQSFIWNLPFYMGITVAEELEIHQYGITRFVMINNPEPFDDYPILPWIQTAQFSHLSLTEDSTPTIVSKIKNLPNIKKLVFDVGTEHLETAENRYHEWHMLLIPDIWQEISLCKKEPFEATGDDETKDDNGNPELLKLESLRIRRISIAKLPLAVDLKCITSLTLHDCRDTIKCLDYWGESSSGSINLKKLRITVHSLESDGLRAREISDGLEKFLLSFSGLRELSCLSSVYRQETFRGRGRSNQNQVKGLSLGSLRKHADTLETLVLHDYYHRNTSPRHYYNYRGKHELIVLYKHFTALKSLAIPIDYGKFDAELTTLGLLAGKLKHMRICNYRQPTSPSMKDFVADANAIATVDLRTHKKASDSRLKLIIFGGDYYNPAHHFYIERATNVLNEQVPLVTYLHEKTAKKLQGPLPVTKHQWWFPDTVQS